MKTQRPFKKNKTLFMKTQNVVKMDVVPQKVLILTKWNFLVGKQKHSIGKLSASAN